MRDSDVARKLLTLSLLGLIVCSVSPDVFGEPQGSSFAVSIAAPNSIESLTDSSTLVIDGHVQGVFPATQVAPDTIETDFIIRVDRVIKGNLSASEIVVSQLGGRVNGRTLSTRQFSMMQPGEHYIFFLFPASSENRPESQASVAKNIRPDRPGLERYKITAVFAGLLRVDEGNRAHWSEGMPPKWKETYESMSVAEIKSRIENHITVPK